ncbi:Protein kinase domain-containing protein [Aphelenchoides besseyi]|nr:Protein kinase domain-containing protein [Aphelenchoides besseyi]
MAMASGRKLAAPKLTMPAPQAPPRVNLDDQFVFKADDGTEHTVKTADLIPIRELGRGAYGVVEEMKHRDSGMIFAVKRMNASINDESQKRLMVELDTCMKGGRCPQMVTFYGAMFRESDVWICMEVMDISLDKFYRKCVNLNCQIPELFIGKLAVAVVDGLSFMKTQMNLIHRDVKPSNILLNRHGEIKICDFGISGHLTNSVAKTVNAGCKPYMGPERIDGDTKASYGVQADVWSLGITLVEIAMGKHPYDAWKTPFEQLKQVVHEPPPQIDSSKGYSIDMRDFVSQCLIKNYRERPKYDSLVQHPFLVHARNDNSFDVGNFIASVLSDSESQEQK